MGTQETETTVTSSTQCTANNDGGPGVYAHATCCAYRANDGYELDCKTKWGSAKNWISSVGCDSGYTLMGCSGWSNSGNALNEWYWDGGLNQCIARSVSTSLYVRAVATCCRLYAEPTSLPIPAPLPGPAPLPSPAPLPAPLPGPVYKH